MEKIGVLQPKKAGMLYWHIRPQQQSKPILGWKPQGGELKQLQTSYSAHAVIHAEAGIPETQRADSAPAYDSDYEYLWKG